MIALDEFALQSVPYTHYAWAIKNSKPKIRSDERSRQKINGFLTVDVERGTTQVEFKESSKTEDVIKVIVFITLIYLKKGFKSITFLMDNAKTHGSKMENGVIEWLAEIAQQVNLPKFNLYFWHTPRYSPKLNPAEYVIHEVRRSCLYHVPCSISLNEKTERIRSRVAQGSPMNERQMHNLIDFIARTKVRRF